MLGRLRTLVRAADRRLAAEPDPPRCPQCFNHVLFGRPACLRCDRPLPPIFDVPERPRLIPLTHRQRRRLRLSALLVAFGPLSLWIGLGLFFFIQQRTWDKFPMFTLIGLLMVAIAAPLAWRSWSDAGGDALLQRAYLLDLISVKRSSSHSAGSSISYYAAFSQLGRFEVTKEDFDRLALGERYQLTYSPRSGKLWSFRQG